jgi:alanyl-tRNA synthetase
MNIERIFADSPKSDFVFWEDGYAKRLEGALLTRFEVERKDIYFTIDKTIFHPKNGGQPSDRGLVTGNKFEIEVRKAILFNGNIVHYGKLRAGLPVKGTKVTEEIDWNFRYKVMRRHTCAHLIDHLLSGAMGATVRTTDSWLGEPCYVGYFGRRPTAEEIRNAKATGEKLIGESRRVTVSEIPYQKFVEESPQAPNILRLPKLEKIRVVQIEGCLPIPCGGTHVHNLSEVGDFQILRTETLDGSFRLYYDVT